MFRIQMIFCVIQPILRCNSRIVGTTTTTSGKVNIIYNITSLFDFNIIIFIFPYWICIERHIQCLNNLVSIFCDFHCCILCCKQFCYIMSITRSYTIRSKICLTLLIIITTYRSINTTNCSSFVCCAHHRIK